MFVNKFIKKVVLKIIITLSDYLPDEQELKTSISMGISNATFMNEKFTFIDCPGSNEFINEFLQATRISDACIIVCEPTTEKNFIPCPFFLSFK